MGRAALGRLQLLLQLLAWLSLGRPAEGLFVTDYFTRTPRKLNPFRSFTSIELFHFRIPEDTVVAVWNLITFKEQGGTFGDQCPDRSITVYFRSGAPPVINPLHTHFPRDTAVPGSFALTLTWTLPNRTTGVFNITSPLPGDWFLAAHLPKEQGKISVKGLHPKLHIPGAGAAEELPRRQPERGGLPAVAKSAWQGAPPAQLHRSGLPGAPHLPPGPGPPLLAELVLHPGGEVPGSGHQRQLPAGGAAEGLLSDWPGSRPLPAAWLQPEHAPLLWLHGGAAPGRGPAPLCAQQHPAPGTQPRASGQRVLPPHPPHPAQRAGHLLRPLLHLLWPQRLGAPRPTGHLCHQPPAHPGQRRSPQPGAQAECVLSTRGERHRFCLPESRGPVGVRRELLSHLRDRLEPCGNVTAEVYLRTYLSPCINDCGPYGQCKLLRTNNYLYAACECKAGWSGWGCTDNTAAFSYGFQLLSTLLLCLSNLMFVPPVVIAVRSNYILEAAVYIFTMFFSTFYHACDQPGIVVFCIMDYDVLQFCDFLGSLMSVWVTVIAMARLQMVIKQVLYLLGAMLLSMALQLDRHGLWNLLGPSLFALGIMAVAWTARSIRRRHCYPPTWQRWTFYLLPGALIAASAVLLYAFVETEENYFYIHSIWHMLIAGSVGFLLPPQAKPESPGLAGPLPRRKGCGYQLCINEQEELGLVDPGAGASVTSVCTS
ncbi:transmembrane protein 8B isoform X3 [Podarcis raffonei]|uniref:transmembrane protein 8B isoform X3 n=1 Tax=Podarcis raffonei TaxID=65483 RepID=UPI00232989D9|nr:transmembrane protein 8B isoform X3 [Podarcis raffonei]